MTGWGETFDLTVVINLDKRPQRLRHISSELSKHDIPFVRIAGVPGMDLPPRLAPVPEGIKHTPTAGMVGSLYSHYLAISLAKVTRASSVCIIEDDAKLPGGFTGVALSFMKRVPFDWEMVYFGGTDIACSTGMRAHLVAPGVCRVHYMVGLTFYAIRETVYDKALRLLETRANWTDALLACLHSSGKVYTPEGARLVEQVREFGSDNTGRKGTREG